ncbi:MAG: DUF2252 family protein [Terriglobales bacterium]
MNIFKATKRYEAWLGERLTLVNADVELKHELMAGDSFSFLRATFYRWMQLWPEICPELDRAPRVLSVGDLHVENFGTWRDAEGRLIWGINDFDEACPLPYPVDLVRLATSAHFAIVGEHLCLAHKEACRLIEEGYREGLKAGGEAVVVEDRFPWLRPMALGALRDPIHFWKKMNRLPTVRGRVPVSASAALRHLLPAHDLPCRLVHRVAGLGSLGRQRIVALGEWEGGQIAREAKTLTTSAAAWAGETTGPGEIYYQTMLHRAVRCRDPWVEIHGQWLVRRLAPDCSRIELASLPKQREEERLLHLMGWETANVHLGEPEARKALRRHLQRRPPGWLFTASKAMAAAIASDWQTWHKDWRAHAARG